MESRIRVVRPIFLEPLEMPSRSASRSMLESLAIACLLDPICNSAATLMVIEGRSARMPDHGTARPVSGRWMIPRIGPRPVWRQPLIQVDALEQPGKARIGAERIPDGADLEIAQGTR